MADNAVWGKAEGTGSLWGHEVAVDAESTGRGSLVAVLTGVLAGQALGGREGEECACLAGARGVSLVVLVGVGTGRARTILGQVVPHIAGETDRRR